MDEQVDYNTSIALQTSKSGWHGEPNYVMVRVDVTLEKDAPTEKVEAHARHILGNVLTKLCANELREERKCRTCGKTFTPLSPQHICCDNVCAMKSTG